MPTWAEPGDYATWTGKPAPDGVEVSLKRASNVITAAIGGSVYDVDSSGLPTDTAILEALRDATCAQAMSLATSDVSNQMDAAGWGNVGIGSVTLGAKSGSTSTVDASSTLSGEASTILSNAGLLTNRVWIY